MTIFMRMSWKLGRVAGIDLFLHPTFLLVLAYPMLTGESLEALPLILSAFGCVLLHELGHALMARRYGIETEDITLYPIGGVARLRRMPRSPGAELLIALAGPAVNVVIALALAVVVVPAALSGYGPASAFDVFLFRLMVVNVGLVLFNLVPAFPMDGGRVLRALLSGWLGRARATTVAAGLGRGLAILFGLYHLVHGNMFPVFLAAFIYFAASAELARVLAEERRRDEDRFPGGDWSAPPGFRWIRRGNGVWQLAPIAVHVESRNASPWA
jgi:Zn-dependent protease